MALLTLVFAAAGLLASNRVYAQQGGSPLASGSTYKGTISADVKRVIYSYTAKAGDIIAAHVVGLTDGMNPTLNILSPGQSTLATSNSDPFNPLDDPDVRLSYWLRDAGAYLIQVSGTDGDYLLRFKVRQSAVAGTLTPSTPITFDTSPGVSQVYTFAPDANAPQTLSITSTAQGFRFAAEVYDPVGLRVATIGGPSVNSATLALSPGNSGQNYEVVIAALTSNKQGSVTIALTGSAPSGPVSAPANAAQPTVAPTNTPATDQNATEAPTAQSELPTVTGKSPSTAPAGFCSVTPIGTSGVFVRTGPGPAYPPVSSLLPGSYLIVNRHNTHTSCYSRV